MDKQNDSTKIIDWADRKEVMATYRKFEEFSMTGPNYQNYDSKLLLADEPMMPGADPVPYEVESEHDGNQESGSTNPEFLLFSFTI